MLSLSSLRPPPHHNSWCPSTLVEFVEAKFYPGRCNHAIPDQSLGGESAKGAVRGEDGMHDTAGNSVLLVDEAQEDSRSSNLVLAPG